MAPKNPQKKSSKKSLALKKNILRKRKDVFRGCLDGVVKNLKALNLKKHMAELKKTPFIHIFEAIDNGSLKASACRRTNPTIEKIMRSYEKGTTSLSIGDRKIEVSEELIRLIFGIVDGNIQIEIGKKERPSVEFIERKGIQKLSKRTIENQLRAKEITSKDFARCAVLYVLAHALAPTQGYNIGWYYTRFVEDVDKTCQYNWSLFLYDVLMVGLNKEPKGSMGCVLILAYCLCECSRIIKPLCSSAVPRCVKWDLNKLTKALRGKDITDFFHKVKDFERETEEEKRLLHLPLNETEQFHEKLKLEFQKVYEQKTLELENLKLEHQKQIEQKTLELENVKLDYQKLVEQCHHDHSMTSASGDRLSLEKTISDFNKSPRDEAGLVDEATMVEHDVLGDAMGSRMTSIKKTVDEDESKSSSEVSVNTDQAGMQDARANLSDDDEGSGLSLYARSRSLLMHKLDRTGTAASFTGLTAAPTLGQNSGQVRPGLTSAGSSMDSVRAPSECLLLKNMFDPSSETEPDFDLDIKEDVRDECLKYGRLKHIHVEKHSAGFVYLRFENMQSAIAAQKALHGRWFDGKMITATYMVLSEYDAKFPGSS